MEKVPDELDIEMTYSVPGEHASVAELMHPCLHDVPPVVTAHLPLDDLLWNETIALSASVSMACTIGCCFKGNSEGYDSLSGYGVSAEAEVWNSIQDQKDHSGGAGRSYKLSKRRSCYGSY